MQISLIGRVPGTDIYRQVELYPTAEVVPGVLSVRVDGPIFFGNAINIRDFLVERVSGDRGPPRVQPGGGRSASYPTPRSLTHSPPPLTPPCAPRLLAEACWNCGIAELPLPLPASKPLFLPSSLQIDHKKLDGEPVQVLAIDLAAVSDIDSTGVHTLVRALGCLPAAQPASLLFLSVKCDVETPTHLSLPPPSPPTPLCVLQENFVEDLHGLDIKLILFNPTRHVLLQLRRAKLDTKIGSAYIHINGADAIQHSTAIIKKVNAVV